MNKTLNQFAQTTDYIVALKDIPEVKLREPVKEGKWSIAEIVGHMYYWDRFNLNEMVPHMAEGADLPSFPDHDEHNKEAMVCIENESAESLIESFVSTRKELIEKISNVGNDVRFTIGGSKRKFSAESFIKIFVKHDAHHQKQIDLKLLR